MCYTCNKLNILHHRRGAKGSVACQFSMGTDPCWYTSIQKRIVYFDIVWHQCKRGHMCTSVQSHFAHIVSYKGNVMIPFEFVLPRVFTLRKILLPQTAHLQIHNFVSSDAYCGTLHLHTAFVWIFLADTVLHASLSHSSHRMAVPLHVTMTCLDVNKCCHMLGVSNG